MDQESPLLSPHQIPWVSPRFPTGLFLPPTYWEQRTEGSFTAHRQLKATTARKRVECSPEVGKSALFLDIPAYPPGALLMAQAVKNPPANARDTRDVGSIPRWGRSSEGGPGNPLQYSCHGNPKDRRAWQVTVCGTAKSWTLLSTQAHAPFRRRARVNVKRWHSKKPTRANHYWTM